MKTVIAVLLFALTLVMSVVAFDLHTIARAVSTKTGVGGLADTMPPADYARLLLRSQEEANKAWDAAVREQQSRYRKDRALPQH